MSGADGGGSPVAGRRALVVGLGRSGAAAATALLDAGADVRVAEARGEADMDPQTVGLVATLRSRGATVVAGGGDVRALLAERDLLVPSPGVPPHAPVARAARTAGIEAWSEPELAWRLARGGTRLLAVTGTNGKTTTTELLAACLGVPAAGNIGTPLSALLSQSPPPPLVVAELSSFQLAATSTLAPQVAVVVNLAPDHLDWHGSFVAYAAAKARVWRAQAETDLAVVNTDDPEAAGLLEAHPPPGRVATTTLGPDTGDSAGVGVRDGWIWSRAQDGATAIPVVAVTELGVSGAHNLANVCGAVAAAVGAGADPTSLAAPLRAYRPGRHRLEHVATVDGVDYVDDSKATNPHAAAAALRTYPSVVWIAGGLNKGLAFDGLAPLLPGRVRAAVTIGSSGPALAATARSAGVPVVEAGTLEAAVPVARGLARPGDTVLLAPACASMDQFTDYAERGRAFDLAVRALARAVPTGGGRDGR